MLLPSPDALALSSGPRGHPPLAPWSLNRLEAYCNSRLEVSTNCTPVFKCNHELQNCMPASARLASMKSWLTFSWNFICRASD
jgi:hypothetical protein